MLKDGGFKDPGRDMIWTYNKTATFKKLSRQQKALIGNLGLRLKISQNRPASPENSGHS
jgi:hypothetical protein